MVTFWAALSMPVTRWPVRTSRFRDAASDSEVCSRRSSRWEISPERWYGRPQFANETYSPCSRTMISACSSRRRARAAALIPPATPPTMTIRMGSDVGVGLDDLLTVGSIRQAYPRGYIEAQAKHEGHTAEPCLHACRLCPIC